MDEKGVHRPSPPKRKRASKHELEQRRRAAEDMLSVGIPPGDVVRHLSTQYRITERQAENYLSFIYARWRRQAPRDDGSRREQLIKMAHTVYIGALQGVGGKNNQKDFRAANQALHILIKLYGVGTGVGPTDPLANLPQDKDRFPGDRSYQILITMRDQLARQGAAGDAQAAGAAARISALISEHYGIVKGAITDEQEARAVAAAKLVLVNTRYFGTPDPQVTGERIDDFAHEQEKAKEDEEP